MEVTEVSSEGLKREFKITIPAGDIETKIASRLSEIAGTIAMPGFRPGKVPVNLLRKTHGQAVMGEVLEQTVGETSQATLTERGLRPVSQPKFEVTEFEDGSDLVYTMELELFPEIDMVDLSTLKLERLNIKADDSQIEEYIQQIASTSKDSKPLTEERPAAEGDVAVIDFVGRIDGEEFAGGKAEGYGLELGSGSFIPGFEEQIIGANVGDHILVKVKFPDEYAEEMAGKDAEFDVDVKELRETVPAEIDDELAKKVGAEDLADLRGKIREEQEKELGGLSRMRLKRELLDQLDELHSFELPANMIQMEFDAVWEQFEHQREHHPDQIDEDDKGKSDDELKTQYREISERRVRLGLLLAEIGRINEIEVSSEEVNRAMVAEAQRHQGQEKEVLDYYRNNPEALQSLQSPILEEKVVDFIIELASVTDRDATIEDLMEESKAKEAMDAEGDESKPEKKAASKAKKKKSAAAAKDKK